jgi:maltooligosyltrehalose trehalohydrolase
VTVRSSPHRNVDRRLSGGVELLDGGAAHARVWAPECRSIDVVLDADRRRIFPLASEPGGFFSGLIDGVAAGDRYWFLIDGERLRPDPVSRFQPDGPHGPSMIVDPRAFAWTDDGWEGVRREGQVVYELHVGTFTPEGTWASAAAQLSQLARLGVTTVEMMPVADFSGRFGWGYDGVNLYAPTHLYGEPDDLRRYIDRAHAVGLAVILDVVYNHLGPDGNYLTEFSREYFTDKYTNDWGQAINFEGPLPARNLFVENAGYWIDEYHFDGLRLDATQDVHDGSEEHVIATLARHARACAGRRRIYIVAENEPQDTRLVRPPDDGGYGLDALWNDDYHHTAAVALTGRREAYYSDYTGSPQELVSSAKYGYLYQGQWYSWQSKRRGTTAFDLPGHAFVAYLENHDQVANSAFGLRMHQLSSPSRYRALTALTLLGPATPMLFQGQEFAATTPFLFFADHGEELREPVRTGRREFLAQFASTTDPGVRALLPDPGDEETFRRSKLDFGERDRHEPAWALHYDLLKIRREDPVIAAAASRRVEGAVLSPSAFLLRYAAGSDDTRLLIVNLGHDLDPPIVPEPLLAPPPGYRWILQWSSESARYGGSGRAPVHANAECHFPGEAAVLLRAVASPSSDRAEGHAE